MHSFLSTTKAPDDYQADQILQTREDAHPCVQWWRDGSNARGCVDRGPSPGPLTSAPRFPQSLKPKSRFAAGEGCAIAGRSSRGSRARVTRDFGGRWCLVAVMMVGSGGELRGCPSGPQVLVSSRPEAHQGSTTFLHDSDYRTTTCWPVTEMPSIRNTVSSSLALRSPSCIHTRTAGPRLSNFGG